MRVSPIAIVGVAFLLVGMGVLVGTSWNDPLNPAGTPPGVQDVASLRDSCGAQELLVGVRGSGEMSDQGGGLGNTIDSVYHRASAHLRTGQLVALPIDYVASSVLDPRLVSMYVQSFTQGREQLFNSLYLWNKKCPNYRFVLAGFSQGADVVADVTTSLDPTIPVEKEILDKIDAVALIGDPRYSPNDARVDAVQGLAFSGVRTSELASYLPFPMYAVVRPPFPDSVAGRTRSWCEANDPVCAFDGSKFAAECARGSVYLVNGAALWAASCAAKWIALFEPHLRYADAGMTEAAGAWIADRVNGAATAGPPDRVPAGTTSASQSQPSPPVVPRPVPTTTREATRPSDAPVAPTPGQLPQTTTAQPPALDVDPNPPPGQDPGGQPSLRAGAQPLGGVDLDSYCSQWSGRRAALRYPNAWGWRCGYEATGPWRSSDQNVSVMDACALQYGPGAISHYDSYFAPDSWKCWR